MESILVLCRLVKIKWCQKILHLKEKTLCANYHESTEETLKHLVISAGCRAQCFPLLPVISKWHEYLYSHVDHSALANTFHQFSLVSMVVPENFLILIN